MKLILDLLHAWPLWILLGLSFLEFDGPLEWLKAMAGLFIVLPAMILGLSLLFFLLII